MASQMQAWDNSTVHHKSKKKNKKKQKKSNVAVPMGRNRGHGIRFSLVFIVFVVFGVTGWTKVGG